MIGNRRSSLVRLLYDSLTTAGDRNASFDPHLITKYLRRIPGFDEKIYCARRDGDPSQGMPGRPICRAHLNGHPARQPAAPVVRLDGLPPDVGPTPHRPWAYPLRRGGLRNPAPQAIQDRRPRHRVRAQDQAGHDRRQSLAREIGPRPRLTIQRRLSPSATPPSPFPPTALDASDPRRTAALLGGDDPRPRRTPLLNSAPPRRSGAGSLRDVRKAG